MEKRLFHIGIVGLGLIGGSLAKALDKYTSHVLYGYDQDAQALELAGEMIDGKLDNKLLSQCDIYFWPYIRKLLYSMFWNIWSFLSPAA